LFIVLIKNRFSKERKPNFSKRHNAKSYKLLVKLFPKASCASAGGETFLGKSFIKRGMLFEMADSHKWFTSKLASFKRVSLLSALRARSKLNTFLKPAWKQTPFQRTV